MKVEFTAVYEQQADGSVWASVAELPRIKVCGKSLEEARASLAEQLRRVLEDKRDRTLARTSSIVPIETISVELSPPSPSRRRPRRKRKGPSWSKTQMQLWQSLLDAGRIDEIPTVPLDPDAIDPILIEGRPISEEIIEDRR
jgi:predicted RNase H-like HicB family nuclease